MKSYREAVDAAANWLARLDDREVVAVIEMCARAVELLDQRTHGVNVLDGLERGARPHYRDLLRPSVYRAASAVAAIEAEPDEAPGDPS